MQTTFFNDFHPRLFWIFTETIHVVLLYYLILAIWLNKKRRSTNTDNTIISKKALSIIGKSTYIVDTTPTIDSQAQSHEIDLQPMQIDFEMEYDDNEEDILIDSELEEIGLISNEAINSAQGLSFEEMSQALDIIQNDNKSIEENEERQAVQTIAKMQQTDLFELMIKHIYGGRQRVADMLNRAEMENTHTKIEMNLKGLD